MQKSILGLLSLLLLAGCAQLGVTGTRPPERPPVEEPQEQPQDDALAQSLASLAATLPDGDIAVVRVANYSSQRLDTAGMTARILGELSQQGRDVADLSARADAFDLLSARQAGREGGHQYLLYGQIRESGDSLRLRVMALANGIIVWSRELPVPR
ncbi:lipoprotein [Gallaecimonas xiamenensis]|uniref:Type IV secretion system putative lipoprotein virB7 n=1 Tax=Gallaecimonas xiamenensis 3-C-1 TaxID=745411 RepID=K2ID13_9GAMM|nr:hypothetical protein [Gallaecimonas xiamenensis]EKE67866.1 hypothetical protein B3C1_18012 [Gallaecimonas xiamenensis 3-C-1]